MEVFVQIVFILALLKYSLKAALSGRFWTITLYSLVGALFALAIYPFVITQPVNIISEILANKKVVTDGAVLIAIEAVSGIFISILLLDNYFVPRTQRKRSLKYLKILPGILVFPAIAYFELLFFKMSIGVDFMLSATIYASIIFVMIMLVSLFIKSQMSHESVKLELVIMLNLAVLVIGLLINSTVADHNLSNTQTVIEWQPLLAIVGIVVTLFGIGVFVPKLKIKSLLKLK